MTSETEFVGTKLMLFLGDRLVVLRRDDRPDIPFPGYLDLPGGGRSGRETPEECVIRECHEETALGLNAADLSWRQKADRPSGRVWYFAAHLGADLRASVQLGDEGQEVLLMDALAFAGSAESVPHFKSVVITYLSDPANGL